MTLNWTTCHILLIVNYEVSFFPLIRLSIYTLTVHYIFYTPSDFANVLCSLIMTFYERVKNAKWDGNCHRCQVELNNSMMMLEFFLKN